MMNTNTVHLIGWYGGDKAIARAAWVSTQANVDSKSDEQIRDLLVNKLWNNSSGKPHKTPFERGIVEFNILVEQASHIQQLKHRLANVNGESARYLELKGDNFYIPKDWEDIPVDYDSLGVWPGECFRGAQNWGELLGQVSELTNELYHEALKQIQPVLGRKRAKESARFFKTMNSQINLSVMMNMSCFYNFVTLRNDNAAQKEITWVARDMVEAVKAIEGSPFKHTMEAFKF